MPKTTVSFRVTRQGGVRAMLAEQTDLNDIELMAAVGRGEARAVAHLYDRYATFAFSLAYRLVGDRESAEEVVQESFLAVWRYAHRYDAARCPLRPWLIRMVRQRSIDHLRSRGARPLTALLQDDHPGATDVWRDVAEGMLQEQVRWAMSRLPDEQRIPIELAYFGGQTHTEIAQQLNLPLGTVKGRLRLGMKKLQLLLSPALQ